MTKIQKVGVWLSYARLRSIEDFVSIKARRLQTGRLSSFDVRTLYRVHQQAIQLVEVLTPAVTSDLSRASALGVKDSEVILSSASPDWNEMFRCESERLYRVFSSEEVKIYHTGSTSVPGLAAKPIIDFAVTLPASRFLMTSPFFIQIMESEGYRYLGDWGKRGGRFFEKVKSGERTHAAQFLAEGGPEIKRLLRFRQMLRTDRNLVEEYSRVKQGLADTFPENRGAYFWLKGHWLDNLLLEGCGADAWARWWAYVSYPTILRICRRSIWIAATRWSGKPARHPMEI